MLLALSLLLPLSRATFVATPFGLRHKDCILEVPNGAIVDADNVSVLITDVNGVTTAHPPCATPTPEVIEHSVRTSNLVHADPSCNEPPCTCDTLPCNNWIDNAGSMDVSTAIGGMSATYLTPSTPSNDTKGQTLFFFIGAENTDGVPRHGQPPPSGRAILQPVLTYDPSGWCVNSTTGWCFSSWNCCPKNVTTHSPYITDVKPGDLFFGSFNLSEDGMTYETLGRNLATGEETKLKSMRRGRNFNWADVTQEVYTIESCNDFSPSGMEFRDVKLWDTEGNTMVPKWLLTGNKPCNGVIKQSGAMGSTFTVSHELHNDPIGQPSGKWTKYAPLSDEFSQDGELDSSKWSTDLSVVGWSGRAPGLFSPSNVVVSDGSVKMYARSAKRNDSWPKNFDNFTTSAIHSLDRTSEGYFEIRSRSGNSSISSSFWFHQNDGNGSCTEIEVFESTGSDAPHAIGGMNSKQLCSHTHIFELVGVDPKDFPNKCGGCAQHTSSSGQSICSLGGCVVQPFSFDDGFHVYGLEWNSSLVSIYVDGNFMQSFDATCFQQKIGMDFDRETMPEWMGLPDEHPLFTVDQPFEIDYVRAWKEIKEEEE
jgi:hypothetical protein